jgi:hypothetical protein
MIEGGSAALDFFLWVANGLSRRRRHDTVAIGEKIAELSIDFAVEAGS